jgi:hypothetical protein
MAGSLGTGLPILILHAAPRAFVEAEAFQRQVRLLEPRERLSQLLGGTARSRPAGLLSSCATPAASVAERRHLLHCRSARSACFLLGSGRSRTRNTKWLFESRRWLKTKSRSPRPRLQWHDV